MFEDRKTRDVAPDRSAAAVAFAVSLAAIVGVFYGMTAWLGVGAAVVLGAFYLIGVAVTGLFVARAPAAGWVRIATIAGAPLAGTLLLAWLVRLIM